MVQKGALGKYTPAKPSPARYTALVAILILYSVVGGYFAGMQPTGKWRFFSWHPFFMTCGMIGTAGVGAVTKKLGGYTNTKLHGYLGFASLLLSSAGLYCIYSNKESNGYMHLKSAHAKAGAGVFLSLVSLGMAGGVFLHPDFGVDKTNKTIRFAHKTASRLTLIGAWVTAFLGLYQLVPDNGMALALYGLPLVGLVPFVLM